MDQNGSRLVLTLEIQIALFIGRSFMHGQSLSQLLGSFKSIEFEIGSTFQIISITVEKCYEGNGTFSANRMAGSGR